jgi:hypothetical protein
VDRSPAFFVPIVWVLFILKAVFYASFIPLWEGFDEFSHFGVVQYLALTGEMPRVGSASNSREVAESLKYVPAPWTIRGWNTEWRSHDAFWRMSPADRDRLARSLFTMPAWWAGAKAPELGSLYEAQQPPLAYIALYVPYKLFADASLPLRVWVLRMFCCAVSSLIVPIGFVTARRVFMNGWQALGAVLMICAMPEFLITATRLSNEALAILLGTASLYFVTRISDPDCPMPLLSSLALGAALGFGLLTKAYFLALLIPVAGLYACLWWTRKRWRGKIATQASITFLVVFAVAGWWYAQAFFMTGSITGEQQAAGAARSSVGLLHAIFKINWLRVADFALVSYLWLGGWSFLVVRSWMYRILEIVLLSGVAGLLVRRKSVRLIVWVYLSFLLTFACAVGFQALSAYRSTGGAGAFGYYAYSIVVAEAVCLLMGITALMPGKSKRFAIPLLTGLFSCLEVFGVCFYQMPYYGGLIGHNPKGTVGALHLDQITQDRFSIMFRNLAWGKPAFIDANAMQFLWALFLAGVIGILLIGILAGRRANAESHL